MAKHESMKEEAREEKKEHDKHARGGKTHMTHGGMREASGGMGLKTEGPMPGVPGDVHEDQKSGGKTHHRRRRGGKSEGGPEFEESGKTGVNVYNAKGSPEMKEAEDDRPGFKRGGKKEEHKKRRDGGHAEGKMAEARLDRRPRRAAGGKAGHDPYSSASAFKHPEDGKGGRGFEAEGQKDDIMQ